MKQPHAKLLRWYHQLDHHLLIHKPWIWETKVHLAVMLGFSITLVSGIATFLYPAPPLASHKFYVTQPVLTFVIATLSVIGGLYWLFAYIKFKGDVANTNLTAAIYKQQFIAVIISVLCFFAPLSTALLIDLGRSDLTRTAEFVGVELLTFAFFGVFLALGVNLLKSLALKKIVIMVSTAAMLMVVYAITLQVAPILSAFFILAVPVILLIYFTVVYDQKRISYFRLFVVCIGHVLALLLCWVKAAVFCLVIFLVFAVASIEVLSFFYVLGIWSLGTGLYIQLFFPKQQYFYLAHQQQPAES